MKISKLIKGAVVAGGILVAVKGLDERLETTHYTIESDKIPEEFDEFRIVQISDLHAAQIPGVAEEVRSERPDIIVSTGDLVDDEGPYEPGIRLCEKLLNIAPVYAVTGNHDLLRPDYHKFQRALDATGTITLHDESIEISREGTTIVLSGIDDPFSVDGTTLTENIYTSLKSVQSTDRYHILLFHRANHMDLLKDKGFDLILAGHMHGGQFRFPNGRGICNPKSSWGSNAPFLFPKYFAGHYRYNSMDMIVNRGLGNPMIIPRLFNRPEITVIILKHKEKK